VIESPDTNQASVVFLGRKSFRMQVVGAPAAATGAGAVPVGTWDTPTERIFERRRSPPAAWPPPATPSTPALGKTTVVGIALITFASGVLVATAVDRVRPHLPRAAHADVGQPAPAPAATPAAAATVANDERAAKPVAAAAPTPAPATAPTPLAAGGPIVQPLPPPPPEPLPALAAPVAAAGAARPVQAKAKARPAPTPTPVAAKATNAGLEPPPFAPIKDTVPAPSKTPAAKAEPAKPVITPPTPGKWVDPFAD
jgi:hypothetical protein